MFTVSSVEPYPWGGLPPIVLDLSVLLTPWGPWLVQRLAQHTPVWLPRCLPTMLEAGELTGAARIPYDAPPHLAETIALWQRCWPDFVQAPRVYWFGDALEPSRAPKGMAPALLDRLDGLIAMLDRTLPECDLLTSVEPGYETMMIEGARDALALAAALPGQPPVLLTAMRHGDGEPWACCALDKFRLPGQRLGDERLCDLLATQLLRGLAGAGLAPLLSNLALRLAALHVLVPATAEPLGPARPGPGMVTLGDPEGDALTLAFEDTATFEDAGSMTWEHAMFVWHELT